MSLFRISPLLPGLRDRVSILSLVSKGSCTSAAVSSYRNQPEMHLKLNFDGGVSACLSVCFGGVVDLDDSSEDEAFVKRNREQGTDLLRYGPDESGELKDARCLDRRTAPAGTEVPCWWSPPEPILASHSLQQL